MIRPGGGEARIDRVDGPVGLDFDAAPDVPARAGVAGKNQDDRARDRDPQFVLHGLTVPSRGIDAMRRR